MLKSDRPVRIWTCVCLALVLFFLMWQVPKTLELGFLTRWAGYFPYVWCAMAVLSAVVYRLYRQPMVLTLAAALAWMTAVCTMQGTPTLRAASITLYPCVYAFFVCFPAGIAAGRKGLRTLLRIMCALWTLWMTALAAAGLYAAFAGVHLHQTQAVRFIGINAGDWRLYLMDYCTNAAGNLMLSILMCVIAMACERKPWVRLLYGLCTAVMLSALSLTDARTSFIGLGAGLSLVCALWLDQRIRSRSPGLRLGAALGCGVVVTVAVYLALTRWTDVLGSFVPEARRAGLFPVALADGVVAHRSIAQSLLTYRDDAWRGLFALLADQPRLLLTGVSPVQPMAQVAPYIVSVMDHFDHMHCIYLQILLEFGLPGLLLALGFLAQFARHALRVMCRGQRALWVRLLPVPALALLLCETVECLTIAHINAPAMALLFLFMGFTAAADREDLC